MEKSQTKTLSKLWVSLSIPRATNMAPHAMASVDKTDELQSEISPGALARETNEQHNKKNLESTTPPSSSPSPLSFQNDHQEEREETNNKQTLIRDNEADDPSASLKKPIRARKISDYFRANPGNSTPGKFGISSHSGPRSANRSRDLPRVQTINEGTMKIMTFNAKSSLKWNTSAMMEEIRQTGADITFVTETGSDKNWLTKPKIAKALAEEGLKICPALSKDNRAGHVAFVYKAAIKINDMVHYEGTGRALTLVVDSPRGEIRCTGLYRGFDEQENEKLHKIIESEKHDIIMGDFNEILGPLDYSANYRQKTRKAGKLVSKIMSLGYQDTLRNFHPTEGLYTFVKKTSKGTAYSRLDYIFTSQELSEDIIRGKIEWQNYYNTDHLPVWVEANITTTPCALESERTRINVRDRDAKVWSKWAADQDEYWTEEKKREISALLWEPTRVSIDTATEIWTKGITHNMEEIFKTSANNMGLVEKKIIGDNIIHELKREERRIRNDINRKRSTDHESLRIAGKRIKERRFEIIKQERDKSTSEVCEKIKKDRSKIFKAIQGLGKKGRRNTELPFAVKIGSKVTSNPDSVKATVRETWKKMFETRMPNPAKQEWHDLCKRAPEAETLTGEIGIKEVAETCASTAKGKAMGTDNIPNELLQNLGRHQLELLTKIFNACSKTKTIPKMWKNSKTTLLYKGSGPKTDPLNYRPIALLSCPYKVYSTIITKRLTNWAERNNILDESQHGFRKGHDTTNAAAELFTVIKNAKLNDKDLHVLLLDIAKAYDSVELNLLFQTLENYGLALADISLIRELLIHNTTEMLTHYGTTEKIQITRGVRQGDIISPILFALFLNPLLIWLKDSKEGYQIGNEKYVTNAFADDTLLMSRSKKGIEEMASKVARFMNYNKINVNAEKSQYAWSDTAVQTHIKFNGKRVKELGTTGFFRYLGWTTSIQLDWTQQETEIFFSENHQHRQHASNRLFNYHPKGE